MLNNLKLKKIFGGQGVTATSATTVATHNGDFHADEVFAVAALQLALGISLNVVRTRDEAVISKANYIVDVGGIHDVAKNRFDHHQTGGAGVRANGIPYASFGLVWQAFGEKLTGSKAAADIVDCKLIAPTDAMDNGVSISKGLILDVRAYDLNSVIGSMNPQWNEDKTAGDKLFAKAVDLATEILKREIRAAQSDIEADKIVVDTYQKSPNKQIIIFDRQYPSAKVLSTFPEPLFYIFPKAGDWRVRAVRNNMNSFENRKDLPAAWAGKRREELAAITGVPDALFCHNKLFTAAAETKEGAMALARIAVDF